MNTSYGQELTKVEGRITDAKTGEPLSFVNVSFKNKNVGTSTDLEGYYQLKTQWASDTLMASFVGYEKMKKPVEKGATQTINFKLRPTGYTMEAVEVQGKRERYKNKGNPAVELIRKVSEKKSENRLESADHYEYEKYQKTEVDLNNITEKFMERDIWDKFRYVFEFVDTSEINGKPYLPIFLRESRSTIYYRGSPESRKEYKEATKVTGFENYLDNEGVDLFLDQLYRHIDVYNDRIHFLRKKFVSPTANIAPLHYKFFIMDTLSLEGDSCIHLSFVPRNKTGGVFQGDLYITDDTVNAIRKVELKVTQEANINFVNDMEFSRDYKKVKQGERSRWVPDKEHMVIDFKYDLMEKGIGLYGRVTNHFQNYRFGRPRADSIYSGLNEIIHMEGAMNREETYWEKNRFDSLTATEKGIKDMSDSITNVPAFDRTIDIIVFILTGYKEFGPLDVGPFYSFLSHNEIEGFRFRFGAVTNEQFSEHWRLSGYGAYGLRDERFKYAGSLRYSFLDEANRFLKGTVKRDNYFPGLKLAFTKKDNFFLSFRRGVADQMFDRKRFSLSYGQNIAPSFKFRITGNKLRNRPRGELEFRYKEENGTTRSVNALNTTELTLNTQFAPNAKTYNTGGDQHRIQTTAPVFNTQFTRGFDGVLGGGFDYNKLDLRFTKRSHFAPFGYNDLTISGGRIWGQVPYPLMNIHRANQTFAYSLRSYNLMNFLEFVSDRYVSFRLDHYFDGYFLNKIPLLKRLKFRGVTAVKAVWGKVGPKNDPRNDPVAGRMAFPVNEKGGPVTFTLEDRPYIEASIGIENILKFFRVDIVKRFTYLDNPSVPSGLGSKGVGIRGLMEFKF